jgi:hypothetical protein
MALVSKTIPNLVQGVSQQPEVLRLSSQFTSQLNGFSSVVEGLKKRPNTTHIKKISTTALTNAYVHTINRDLTERYIVIITNGSIRVFDTAGNEKTVVMQTGASAYLTSASPRTQFSCTSVADYTFVLNKNITVQMSATTSPAKIQQAVYTCTQGINGIKYSITIDGTTYSTTLATTGSVTTEQVRDGLRTAIGSPAGLTFANIGNSSFSIIKASGTLAVSASDSYGDQASQVIKDTVDNFDALPLPAINNMIVEVTGDATNKFDNYFVKFIESSGGDGVWEETVAPNTVIEIDETKMPHVLIRTADGNFRFSQCDDSSYTISGTSYDVPVWGNRVAGDLTSAPDPSFIGRKINEIFFHRNRLGFLADENIVMSRSGEFFQFFPETVTQVLDTDPIDVASTHSKVSILRSAVSFDEELLVLSDQTQFILTGGTVLTAANVAINVTTEFESDRNIKPINAGSNVIFGFPKGNYTGFREYYISSDTDVKQAEDITANVPKFIPKNVFKITTATNENIVVAISSDETNAVYVYQYYVSGNKRLQSAWHKWSMGTSANTNILNADFIENTLYLVIQRGTDVFIETLDISPNLTDTGATYLTHLDRKIQENSTGVSRSYNAGTDQTTITLPYAIKNTMSVVTRSGGANISGREIPIVSQTVDGATIVVSGNVSSTNIFIGETYNFTFTFSQQFMQDSDTQGSKISVKEGRLQIRSWAVSYNDTGYFTTLVQPVGRSSSTTTFTGTITGTGLLGTVNLEDGDYEFAVQSENDKFTVTISNDSHLPSNFINASWNGYYVSPSTRI